MRNNIGYLMEAMYRGLLNESPDYKALKALADKAVANGVSKQVGDLGPLKLETGAVDIHDGRCHLVRLCDIMGELSSDGKYRVRKDCYPEMQRIHGNYATAMASHHPDSVRNLRELARTAMNRRYAFTDGDSFIFMFDPGTGRDGKGATGYWVVTHFAPSSNMAGYRLLKELFRYNNIIMAVTDHMWPQMAKMGLVYPEFTSMVQFSGGQAEKMFFTSDKKLMGNMVMKGFVSVINYLDGIEGMENIRSLAGGLLMKIPGLYDLVHHGEQTMVGESRMRRRISKVVNEQIERIKL